MLHKVDDTLDRLIGSMSFSKLNLSGGNERRRQI
jgi:hypothetical protein